MNRTTGITIICGLILSACLLGKQRLVISDLKTKLIQSQLSVNDAPLPSSVSSKPSLLTSKSTSVSATVSSVDQVATKFLPTILDDVGDPDENPIAFLSALPRILDRVRGMSAKELTELANQLPADAAYSSVSKLLLVMAADVDPELILASQDESQLQGAMVPALRSLAAQDPSKVLAYFLKSDLNGRMFDSARAGVTLELFRNDLDRAIEFLRETTGGPLGKYTENAVALALKEPHIRRTIYESLMQIPDLDGRRRLSHLLVRETLASDGLDEARALLNDLPPVSDRDDFLFNLAADQLESHPVEVLSLVELEVSQGHQPAIIERLVSSWTKRDYNAVGAWLGTQTSSPNRDMAIGAYAASVAAIDPITAFQWTKEIDQPELLKDAQETVIQTWARNDAEAAKDWLESQGLPTSEWLTTP